MKTKQEIEAELKRVKKDERLKYKTAPVFENAPLALVQLELETRIEVLEWVLKNEK